MAMVNIPSTNVDPDYRYKMPRLITKIEGRGNAIKTCIVNMGDVARALHCPPQYASKWFGTELGTKSQFIEKEDDGDGEKCLLFGSHEISVFQDLLDEFICKYVCCNDCGLPEMDMYIVKGIIHGKCKACGWDDELDNKHRVAQFITKHPPEEIKRKSGRKQEKKAMKAIKALQVLNFESDDDVFLDDASSICTEDSHKAKKAKKEKKEKKDKKGKKEKKEKKEKTSRKDSVDTEDDFLSKDDSRETVEADSDDSKSSDQDSCSPMSSPDNTCKLNALKPFPSPTPPRGKGHDSPEVVKAIDGLRQQVVEAGEALTVENYFDNLRLAQLAEVFDHRVRLYVTLQAVLGPDMTMQTVLDKKVFIAKAIDSASMPSSDVLWAFDAYLEAHEDATKSFPMVLKAIYDEDWAFEDDILEYYGADEQGEAPGFLVAKEASKPFLKWLSETADEPEESASDLQSEITGG